MPDDGIVHGLPGDGSTEVAPGDGTAEAELLSGERCLHPRVRVVWWVGWVVSDLILIAGITAVTAFGLSNSDLEVSASAYLAAPGLALLAVVWRTWYAGAAYRAWRYELTDEGLELRSGVFWRRCSSMPYHRLQQVDVGQGPLERRFGLSSVQLRSAAATTDASIPGIADADVEPLRRLLMRRAGRDDGT